MQVEAESQLGFDAAPALMAVGLWVSEWVGE